MGHFRFRKTLRLGRFFRINLSKTGASGSIGSHGATVNIGRKGIFATLGLPGSGVSYRQKLRGAVFSPVGLILVLLFLATFVFLPLIIVVGKL